MEVYKIKITLNLERIQQTVGDKAFVESLAANDLQELLDKIEYVWNANGEVVVSHLQESGG